MKSEDLPTDTSAPLKTLVGKNFKQEVIDSGKDVFIKFYAPWCGHCKKMAPTWEKLAAELVNVPGLVIGNFDATANEAAGVAVSGYPTLKLYVGGKPIDFKGGNRELEDFKKFLTENSPAYKKYLETAKPNEEL